VPPRGRPAGRTTRSRSSRPTTGAPSALDSRAGAQRLDASAWSSEPARPSCASSAARGAASPAGEELLRAAAAATSPAAAVWVAVAEGAAHSCASAVGAAQVPAAEVEVVAAAATSSWSALDRGSGPSWSRSPPGSPGPTRTPRRTLTRPGRRALRQQHAESADPKSRPLTGISASFSPLVVLPHAPASSPTRVPRCIRAGTGAWGLRPRHRVAGPNA
jgi:hypothetical protein